MHKVTVAALAVTGSLLVGPAALAAPVDPSGNVPGYYTPQHAGHDAQGARREIAGDAGFLRRRALSPQGAFGRKRTCE